jgi:signal transduction histidine kinase
LGRFANGMIALTNLFVFLLLLTATRGRSILDLWLIVAAFAMLGESTIVTFFILGRFTLGFYAIRLISVPVSKVVLAVLLWETVRLYTNLSISIRALRDERAKRLANAAAMTAAIAHEVRQPITGINLKAAAGQHFLDRASPDVGAAGRILGEIKDAAFRANEVFDNFLSLFRGGAPGPHGVDVNTVTLEAISLLRKDLDDHGVSTKTKLASDLPLVQGQSGQLRVVIRNLVQNAIAAMASTTSRPRQISIGTSCLGSDAISLSLRDTGTGIPAAHLASIFDPFVTTKAQGTGLGLAICKMIIEQHGGKLTAASDAEGACFEITLPVRAP